MNPQCFTIRDLSSAITSLNAITPSQSIFCFYGSRYEYNERNYMKNNILKIKYSKLYSEEKFNTLPPDFPNCFASDQVRLLKRHIIIQEYPLKMEEMFYLLGSKE